MTGISQKFILRCIRKYRTSVLICQYPFRTFVCKNAEINNKNRQCPYNEKRRNTS